MSHGCLNSWHYMLSTICMPMKKHISALAIMFIMHLECSNWRGVAVCEEVGNVKDRCAISILRGPDVVGKLRYSSDVTSRLRAVYSRVLVFNSRACY